MSRAEGVGYHTGCIPIEPLATLVEDYLNTQTKDSAPEDTGPMGMLCIRAKVNPRRLHDLVHRKSKWIDFSNADKLLCAINKTDYLLFHPELSAQYFKVSLRGKPKSTDWVAQVSEGACQECGELFSFYSNFAGRGRTYCSQKCSGKGGARGRWEEEDAA